MKLDFAFDSDLSQLTEDKTNIPRSIHLGQTSAADLNQKIASVKKVSNQLLSKKTKKNEFRGPQDVLFELKTRDLKINMITVLISFS